MQDLTLPSFEMDCRDWVVVTPDEAGIPDEVGGTPLLAMLSTVVIGADRFTPASGVLTIGLRRRRDAGAPFPSTAAMSPPNWSTPTTDEFGMRFVLPTPSGRLALLAEFAMPEGRDPEVVERVEDLMRSFKWAA